VKTKGERGNGEGGVATASGDRLSTFRLPPSPLPLTILLVGDATRPEFRDARAQLERRGSVDAFDNVDAAVVALEQGRVAPDVIVVTQAFPGQFSHAAIERLRRVAPLARVVALLGSWCEGEMRSGRPWPAVRTYWHQWAPRCRRQFQHLVRGESCSWALPPTATEEERVLADASGQWPVASGRNEVDSWQSAVGSESEITSPQPLAPSPSSNPPSPFPLPPSSFVLIRSRSREMWSWLSAACRTRGGAAVWQRDGNVVEAIGATAAIFDATDFGATESAELRRLAAALQPAPVVALLSFPRIEDHHRAIQSGASVVLSKPVAVEDLFCFTTR
jgi:hypothetical protein